MKTKNGRLLQESLGLCSAVGGVAVRDPAKQQWSGGSESSLPLYILAAISIYTLVTIDVESSNALSKKIYQAKLSLV